MKLLLLLALLVCGCKPYVKIDQSINEQSWKDKTVFIHTEAWIYQGIACKEYLNARYVIVPQSIADSIATCKRWQRSTQNIMVTLSGVRLESVTRMTDEMKNKLKRKSRHAMSNLRIENIEFAIDNPEKMMPDEVRKMAIEIKERRNADSVGEKEDPRIFKANISAIISQWSQKVWIAQDEQSQDEKNAMEHVAQKIYEMYEIFKRTPAPAKEGE